MTRSAKDLRYRAYFWLMNAAMVAAVISLSEVACYFATGVRGFGLTGAVEMTADIFVSVFSWLVPFFLMIARFMRDDYSEGLWKRSVVVLAYAVALFPMLFLLLAWGMELGLPHDGTAYAAWQTIYTPFKSAALPGDVIVSTVWQVYMQLFVLIFQFLRWRDSR